jgi:hypothetical protein
VITRETARGLTRVYLPRALALKRAAGVAVGDARQEARQLVRRMRLAEASCNAVVPYGVIIVHQRREPPAS